MDRRVRPGLLSDDTDPEVEEAQIQRWRAMPSFEKARLIVGLCQSADALALAGIKHRYPAASPQESFLRLAMLKLGRDLACRAYPDAMQLLD
jgi:hypothetical protein